jgi:hypothetical protein
MVGDAAAGQSKARSGKRRQRQQMYHLAVTTDDDSRLTTTMLQISPETLAHGKKSPRRLPTTMKAYSS